MIQKNEQNDQENFIYVIQHDTNVEIVGQIPVTFYQEKIWEEERGQRINENDVVVAKCELLDLSAYGDNMEEAKANIADALNILVTECAEQGTLAEVLNILWLARNHG